MTEAMGMSVEHGSFLENGSEGSFCDSDDASLTHGEQIPEEVCRASRDTARRFLYPGSGMPSTACM